MTLFIATVVVFLFGLAQTQARVLTVDCSHPLDSSETITEVDILLNKTQFYKYTEGSGKLNLNKHPDLS